ncbi:MAG: NACHT domain-containing protein [Polyangiales bacterium]
MKPVAFDVVVREPDLVASRAASSGTKPPQDGARISIRGIGRSKSIKIRDRVDLATVRTAIGVENDAQDAQRDFDVFVAVVLVALAAVRVPGEEARVGALGGVGGWSTKRSSAGKKARALFAVATSGAQGDEGSRSDQGLVVRVDEGKRGGSGGRDLSARLSLREGVTITVSPAATEKMGASIDEALRRWLTTNVPELMKRFGASHVGASVVGRASEDESSGNAIATKVAAAVTTSALVPPASTMIVQLQREHRAALEPRLLPRIARSFVREKWVRRIVSASAPTIFFIVGDAGLGKTVALGELADELASSGRCVVVAALTLADAAAAERSLDDELGRALTDSNVTLTSHLAAVAERAPHPILIIDTLDLVLTDPERARRIAQQLRRWADRGITVVTTCRQFEHQHLLVRDPTAAAILDAAPPLTVPRFLPDEIVDAARAFATSLKRSDPEAFANGVLALHSVASTRLRSLIEHPLFLGLVCASYEKVARIPLDLTSVGLFHEYWDRHVARSRREKMRPGLGGAKSILCLKIARALLDGSERETVERFPRTGIAASESTAFDDLLSEGVLQTLPDLSVRFFHQMLLEYAEACSVATDPAAAEAFVIGVQESKAVHRLPVARFLLAIVDARRHEELRRLLDLSDISQLRIAAFAAAAREAPDVSLSPLFKALATTQSTLRQAGLVLCEALDGVPRTWAAVHIETLIGLTGLGDLAVASESLRIAGDVVLDDTVSGDDVRRLVDAILSYAKDTDRSDLLGKFLRSIMEATRGAAPRAMVLRALRVRFGNLAPSARGAVVQLHVLPGGDVEAQALWPVVQAFPDIGDEAANGAAQLVAITALAQASDDPLAKATPPVELRNCARRREWALAFIRGAGLRAGSDEHLLDRLVASIDVKGRGHQVAIALSAAVAPGGHDVAVLATLERRGAVRRALGPVVGVLSETRESTNLARWLVETAGADIGSYAGALATCATRDRVGTLPYLQRAWTQFSVEQKGAVARILGNWLPGDIGDVPANTAPLVRFGLRITAALDGGSGAEIGAAVDELVAAARSPQRLLALAASEALAERAPFLAIELPDSFFSCLASPHVGVRVHIVEAVAALPVDQITTSVIAKICNRLRDPAPGPQCQVLELVRERLANAVDIPVVVAEWIFGLRAAARGRVVVELARAMRVLLGDPRWRAKAIVEARRLLQEPHLGDAANGLQHGRWLALNAEDAEPGFLRDLAYRLGELTPESTRIVLDAMKIRYGSWYHAVFDELLAASTLTEQQRLYLAEQRERGTVS